MKTRIFIKVRAIAQANFAYALVVGLTTLLPAIPVQAQPNPPAILTVGVDEGRGFTGQARTVEVWAGRATAIDFSAVSEKIIQVFLADPSRFTYATDTPLKDGQATTVFLRQIQPLKFPNLTTAIATNLFIKTRNERGRVLLYTFNVQPGKGVPYNTLIVEATSADIGDSRYNSSASLRSPRFAKASRTLQVGSFRPATLEDIERGLAVALRRSYTLPSDRVVAKVRQFLARSYNTTDRTLVEIAQDVQLSLPVLTQLGLLGIENVLTTPSTSPRKVPLFLQNLPQEKLPSPLIVRFDATGRINP